MIESLLEQNLTVPSAVLLLTEVLTGDWKFAHAMRVDSTPLTRDARYRYIIATRSVHVLYHSCEISQIFS